MRAGVVLEVLAEQFSVWVLHIDLWGRQFTFDPTLVQRAAAGYARVVPENGKVEFHRLLERHFPGVTFHAIHTFRLVMAHVTLGILGAMPAPLPFSVLDLDDDECQRVERLITLLEQTGDSRRAKIERAELSKMRMLERIALPRFERIFLASQADADRVGARYRGKVVLSLPNVIRLGGESEALRTPGFPRSLLFVGSLDYLPNEDGLCHFCSQTLPRISGAFREPFRIMIVGSNPQQRVLSLGELPAVEMIGEVADVAPYYARASAVIVPLRAGGGTRIKILEAFCYRRPVVSTTIGVEGLNVEDQVHFLVADTPEAFAEACLRLLQSDSLRGSLANQALAWLRANHSPDRLRANLEHAYAPVFAARG
jgi:glycosyltransferase involved in cell wall biosynthesis